MGGRHGRFQEKVVALLSPFYTCNRAEDIGNFEEIVGVRPFQTELIDILVAKNKSQDTFQVITRVRVIDSIRKKWNSLKDDDKREMRLYLAGIYSEYVQLLKITDDFSWFFSTWNMYIDNLRKQDLLDLIQNDIVLLSKIIGILGEIDTSLNITSTKPDLSMFQ